MISKLDQVMIYVDNPREVASFWTETMGFTQLAQTNYMPDGDACYIEIAPVAGVATTLVLQDRGFVQSMNAKMNTGTPSLMFATDNLSELHQTLKDKGVTVGEILNMGKQVFNFSDPEGNYFAICQV